ncbi:hypothetical protein BAX96_06510 [Elizabethkingia anophelis]|nr:hypothetical protein [Elizabethkingia anophelis]MDV3474533.1 hypothetical protein [Elizabethkingia anophelis]MDV3603764.1 hypothetical protein [Elizabethkingia anophelis]MDV3675218.1 hypothetical protein [Elizabethkingia anophelis]MDV3682294.1 hypothetical protein [Elizabethkingia anophelis]
MFLKIQHSRQKKWHLEKFINTEATIIISIGDILRHRKIKYFFKTKPWQGFKPCQGCLVL